MKNVNFWKETATLYINGIPCAERKTILPAKGCQESVEKFYTTSVLPETHSILTGLFELMYDKTLFTRRPYYQPDYMWDNTTAGWKTVTSSKGRLFEKDIETVRVTFDYTPCNNEVSMKKLFEYSAEFVIEFLKERGITTCSLEAK